MQTTGSLHPIFAQDHSLHVTSVMLYLGSSAPHAVKVANEGIN